MTRKISLRARDLFKAANSLGITLEHNRTTSDIVERNKACLRGLVWLLVEGAGAESSMYDREWVSKIGRSYQDMEALEAGFEGFDHHTNRYYKVGQRVAKMAGY